APRAAARGAGILGAGRKTGRRRKEVGVELHQQNIGLSPHDFNQISEASFALFKAGAIAPLDPAGFGPGMRSSAEMGRFQGVESTDRPRFARNDASERSAALARP